MSQLKYDWQKIEELRERGMTWQEVIDELGLDAKPDTMSKNFSNRKSRKSHNAAAVAEGAKVVTKSSTSLLEFANAKERAMKREACVICKLPAQVRAQLAQAGERGITRKMQIAWLQEVHRVKVGTSDLQAHFLGRHDDD